MIIIFSLFHCPEDVDLIWWYSRLGFRHPTNLCWIAKPCSKIAKLINSWFSQDFLYSIINAPCRQQPVFRWSALYADIQQLVFETYFKQNAQGNSKSLLSWILITRILKSRVHMVQMLSTICQIRSFMQKQFTNIHHKCICYMWKLASFTWLFNVQCFLHN